MPTPLQFIFFFNFTLGQDFVIDPWIKNFWNKTLEMFPLPTGVIPVSTDVLPPPKYKLQFDDIIEIRENETLEETFDSQNPYQATLISNNRVTNKEHFQDTRLVEMKISDKIDFNPGDICLVQPTNSQKNVDTFIEMMSHLDPDKKFCLLQNDENIELPPKSVLPNRVTTLR